MKSAFKLALFFSLFFLTINFAFGISLGVSPGRLSIENILRGGYAETSFIVANPNNIDIRISASAEGEVGRWVRIEGERTIGPKETRDYKVIVTPPDDTPNGNYETRIYVSADTNTDFSGGTGSAVSLGSIIPIYLNIDDKEIRMPILNRLKLEENEKCKPIYARIMVENKGNIRFMPIYEFKINTLGSLTVKEYTEYGEALRPGQKRTDSFLLDTRLEEMECIPESSYVLALNLYDDGNYVDSSEKKFMIYPSGTFSVQGELLDTIYETNVQKGNLVKITALFKNTGESATVARLRGELRKGNKLIDTFESSDYIIGTKETSELEAYFTPKVPGTLNLTAWVQFEGKRTDKFEGTIEVESMEIYAYIAAAAISVIIMAVIYTIYKKSARSKKKK